MRILTNRKKRRADTRQALLIPDTITDTDVRIPLGLHLLISGTTGSGKTNLLLAILSTLICRVEAGDVCLLAVDLKDGVSANAVKNLYTSIAGTIEETVVLLQKVRSLITARNQWLKENLQLEIQPSQEQPLVIIVIDEALQLYGAIDPDTIKQQRKAQDLLDQILLMGRSTAVMIIAAIQDPRKEVFKLRERFPERITLRLNDKAEAIMAMNQTAITQGAAPWLIPTGRPGLAWFYDTDAHTAIRFQAPYINIDNLQAEIENIRPIDVSQLFPDSTQPPSHKEE